MKIGKLFLLALLLLNSSLFAQQLNEAQIQKINAQFEAWNSTHTPGGAVGIFKDGKIIYSNAFGMASLEYDIPNTANTIFNIASVSKQITAYSLVLLEQQGKLSLDDEVQKHLPEVPDFGKKITLRHLMTHTSGLRNFQNILAMAGWREGESMTNDDLLRFISMQKELNFDPGAEYLYCNSGFNLATAIVERLSGQTFQDWTQENIFGPLGMTNTTYREDLEIIHKNSATSYDGNAATGFRQPLKYWTYMGNGNVYTTIEDLGKWLNNFRVPTLGGKEGIETLTTPGILNNGETLSYALGIGVGKYRGLRRFSHGGSVGGYRSNMVYFPDEEMGIIVLSNFSSAGAQPKVFAIADLLLEDKFPIPKEPARSTTQTDTKEEKVDLTEEEITPFVGKYFVDGVVVDFSKKGNQLYIYAEGELPQPLPIYPVSPTAFVSDAAPIKVQFLEGTPIRTRIKFGPDNYRGVQLAATEELDGLEGTYYSPELDTEYHITKDGDQYTVKHQRHDDFELVALSDNKLMGTAYFFNDVVVVRAANGAINGIRVSNGRVRNLLFKKR
ncbi:MAG: serine hydrolase domain-containing protein [Bacteroidota bacterium]